MCVKNVLSAFLIIAALSGIVFAQQTTDMLLMVSPNNFKFNKETAKNKLFQKNLNISNDTALQEFNSIVDKLRNNHVRVIVMPSRQNVETLIQSSLIIGSLYILQKSLMKKFLSYIQCLQKIEDLNFNLIM